MKVLVDTCVVVDVLSRRSPFCEKSQELFLLAASNTIDAFVTAKSVSDIYYLVHKVTHNSDKTKAIINDLFQLFGVIDSTREDILNALNSKIGDYEDAIMDESAYRSGMDCICTRNTKDYKNSKIKAIEPSDLLLQFRK